jgi:hypothetical protein
MRAILRRRIAELRPVARLVTRIEKLVLGQMVLALSVFGDASDIGLLVALLREDTAYELGDATTAALCQLIRWAPEAAPESSLTELRELLDGLLQHWALPSVAIHPDFFARCAQVFDVLCSRVSGVELMIAVRGVQRSGSACLLEQLRCSMERAKRHLLTLGHSLWVSQHACDIEAANQRIVALSELMACESGMERD